MAPGQSARAVPAPRTAGPTGLPGTPSNYPASPATNPGESLAYGAGAANPGAGPQFGADDLWADSAGESFYNTSTHAVSSVNSEPTGPNSPLATDSNGYQLYSGPGFNLDINRPPACTSGSDASTANCVAGEVLGDGGTTSSSTRKDSSGVISSGSSVTGNAIASDDLLRHRDPRPHLRSPRRHPRWR